MNHALQSHPPHLFAGDIKRPTLVSVLGLREASNDEPDTLCPIGISPRVFAEAQAAARDIVAGVTR